MSGPAQGPGQGEAGDAGKPRPIARAATLGVTLDQVPILHDVSFELRRGEVLALLGANGSGKSTLVRALLGIVPATGTIELFGQPLGRRVPWAKIGYVPQRHASASGVPATALEVVTAGLLSAGQLRPPRGARARALHALKTMGVADLARRNIAELSGGQAQRVYLARALAREPELLILDEPTTGVDLHTQDALVEAIEAIEAGAGASAIVILHEIGPFAQVLDRALILGAGTIAAERTGPFGDANGHTHHDPHPGPVPPVRAPELGWEGV